MAGSNKPLPSLASTSHRRSIDDWEHWEDEIVITPIISQQAQPPLAKDTPDLVPAPPAPQPPTSSSHNLKNPQLRASRQSTTRVKRLKSRHRQKAQNARAGIKLITDMSTFRRQNHLRTPDGKQGKFVDAAALRALEGEPNSASVGNWNWLKKQGKSPSAASATKTLQSSATRSPNYQLTPGDAPIMIGISFESDTSGSPEPNNPAKNQLQSDATHKSGNDNINRQADQQPVSVWSPDTPDTASTANNFRAVSSIYSQATGNIIPRQQAGEIVPPVPALPSTYKKMPQHKRLISLELGTNNGDSDDGGTPCTLFEEDGSPHWQAKNKGLGLTPDSAASTSKGWWDHVVTPFMDSRFTFNSRKTRLESPSEGQNHAGHSPECEDVNAKTTSPPLPSVPKASPPPIVRAPTPRRTPTPPSNPVMQSNNPFEANPTRSSPVIGSADMYTEKPQIIVTPEIPMESPPPYSSPKNANNFGRPVKYRAVLPPGHPLQSLPSHFPPSPNPRSPGLAATMSSQRRPSPMTDIPITPTVPREMPAQPQMPLPNRPLGTAIPQEHSHEARGDANRIERERRRHEKEEFVARKVGGFWRGRGCIPSRGCFGRTGPEGRKRRRVWLGVVASIIALIILAVVLGVVLSRPKDAPEPPSIWVNLTDFPPMPTGVLTVVGADNTVARSGCTEPSTIWSCSLPKEDHESVAPYEPNQPTFLMQIQWDNSTNEAWKVEDGKPPSSVSRRAMGGAAHATSMVMGKRADKFSPDPSPPDFQEMWFLGDTTDDVEANDKAGEPAPFYISMLSSETGKVDNPVLAKRQTTVGDDEVQDLVPAPDLLSDGTPAPAQLLPQAVQQPVRLYDRGLSTEHYGFYTYFKRSIYVKSVNQTESDNEDVPLDEDGGCTKSEANFLVTWSETRMLVRIWTRALGKDGSLLESDGLGSIDGSEELIRPGTMPWPVTITLDTHGGKPDDKFVWLWPMDERQKLDEENPKLLPNNLKFGGNVVNHRADGDKSLGGFDGGSGGCKCEWKNWV